MKNEKIQLGILLILALSLLILIVSYFSENVNSFGGSNQTVVVQTLLDVGNVYPEILNVSIDNGAASITLIPNATKLVSCVALLRDYNNDSDFSHSSAVIFNSSYSGSDDNNDRYTNSSCFINTSFGSWNGVDDDDYLALANCTFNLYYYSNPGAWNCTYFVNDSVNWNATNSDTITVNELLAVGLPTSINYGTVNATYVSDEKVANVSNMGNVMINLSLSGYAVTEGDNLSMNCSVGNLKNISIYYEKYNLNESITGALSLTSFENNYTNLTGSPVVKRFNLIQRTDDIDHNAINSTYWRIYVPVGVAGTCEGKIIFGATKASGS